RMRPKWFPMAPAIRGEEGRRDAPRCASGDRGPPVSARQESARTSQCRQPRLALKRIVEDRLTAPQRPDHPAGYRLPLERRPLLLVGHLLAARHPRALRIEDDDIGIRA